MIGRAFAILTLLTCCLTAIVTQSRELPSRGVVVLGNRTPRVISFTVKPQDGAAKKHNLPASGVLALPIDGDLGLTFSSDGGERKYALDANSAYYFAQFPFGIDLEKASFAAPREFIPPPIDRRGGPRPGPKRTIERTPPTDVVKVKLVLDDSPHLARERWEADVRKRFEAAAKIIEHASGLKLKIAAVDSWQPPAAGGLAAVEKEFQQIALGDAWLVLGIVSSRAGGSRPSAHAQPTPLSTHLLVGELSAPAGEAEKTAQLVHLLGHYLGAAESPEPASIMHAEHAGAHARDARSNLDFDAANTLSMQLISADVRERGLRAWQDLNADTQQQVRAIQAALLQAQRGQLATREPGRWGRPPRERRSRGDERPGEMLFTSSLVDGTMLTGAQVRGWSESRSEPTVDQHLIFDPLRPVRWLRNDSVTQKTSPTAFVEFFGGDRLPGSVVRYEAASENDRGAVPAHLAVEPTEPLFWRDQPEQVRVVRVLTGTIKRIVWQSNGERYQPGIVFLRGGGRLSFRSAKYAADGVRLLTDGEVKQLAFSEIAELHLPQLDPWLAYFEQLASLTPTLSERLVNVETSEGLVTTTSTARLRAQSSGDDPRAWMHVVQPVWSLDPLWPRHAAVAMRRFFDASEVLLSSIEPTAVRRKSFFSSAWDWQTNRNTQLGPLRCGVRQFAWGIGTHAYSESQYDLPPAAQSFRCQVGLDHIAASGGCARAIIYAGSLKTKPLYRSELLIGSTRSFDTGDLPLKHRTNEPSRLFLVAHPAHKERPAGADPLDVRDSVDWLEPIVSLDRAALSEAVHRAAPALIPAWAGWTLDAKDAVSLVSLWDKTDASNPRFRVEALPVGESLTLSRKYHVRSASSHLDISASRFGSGVTPSKIEVLVDDALIDDFKVLVDNPHNPQSHLHSFALADYVGRDVEIKIVQHCEGKASSVLWRRLAIVE